MKVPIAKTALEPADLQAVLKPLESGWLVQGPFVREFEEAWSDFTGAKHSVAVTSCTSAMQISLCALGFSPGNKAIVPAFTWVSTANVVEQVGGDVVFCDISLDDYNIDLNYLPEVDFENLSAILPVHLFGFPAEMENIMSFASRLKIKVIEDAACGFNTFFNGKHAGNIGDTGCFSFHPRKAITTGEGGMITTNNDDLANKLRMFRDHGATLSDLQRHHGPRPYLLADHEVPGFNQRMTDFQAALGVEQMKRATQIWEERNKIAQKYNEAFSEVEELKLVANDSQNKFGHQSYPMLYRPKELCLENIHSINQKRNELMEKLQNAGVSTRPATHAVHMLSYYKKKYNLVPESFPNAFIANECSISLPLFNGMTNAEQDYVISNVMRHI